MFSGGNFPRFDLRQKHEKSIFEAAASNYVDYHHREIYLLFYSQISLLLSFLSYSHRENKLNVGCSISYLEVSIHRKKTPRGGGERRRLQH